MALMHSSASLAYDGTPVRVLLSKLDKIVALSRSGKESNEMNGILDETIVLLNNSDVGCQRNRIRPSALEKVVFDGRRE
jgi:hypothetical protein